MNVRAAVLDGLAHAGVDMSVWKEIGIMHLHGATKEDPLNQWHLLCLKAWMGDDLRGRGIKTRNHLDNQFDETTKRLVNGLVRRIKEDGTVGLNSYDLPSFDEV